MSDIIARLEKATGPDRDMDADIARQNGWAEHAGDNWIGPHGQIAVPAYTSSIDAALTLLPDGSRLLELGQWDDNGRPDGWFAQVTRWHRTGENEWTDRGYSHGIEVDGIKPMLAPNGAIALCIAALKARSAVTTADHGEVP